ncbi:MAG TPA: riboflavin synthase [Bacillota bacterium]|nr:riboflavin synthase [Bacillota bacterium]
MFTGIIEEVGRIQGIKRGSKWCVLTIQAKHVLVDVKLGDSIAVNGVCLTVTSFTNTQFSVDVMPETFEKTNLAGLLTGSKVNLERAMMAGGRFGGHMVSGHVDGQGMILSKTKMGNAVVFKVQAEAVLLYYMIPKGSITIDGISLTLLDVEADSFSISIIPHTIEMTTLHEKDRGDRVNLECDMIGKYIAKYLTDRKLSTGITQSFLSEHGFI